MGGATVLLLGMGINLQYALDGYGEMNNKNAVVVWAQNSEKGSSYSCSATFICKGSDGLVNGSVSCTGTENCERSSFWQGVICDGKETRC